MGNALDLAAQGISIGIVIAVLYAGIRIFRCRLSNLLLKIPSYASKNRDKFFKVEGDSVIVFSGIYPIANKQWIVKNNTIFINPDEKYPNNEVPTSIPFSKIDKIFIKERKNWMNGKFYNLLVWHKDSSVKTIPLEHRKHNFVLGFRPFSLEAAQEIERQVNEHIASRKKK